MGHAEQKSNRSQMRRTQYEKTRRPLSHDVRACTTTPPVTMQRRPRQVKKISRAMDASHRIIPDANRKADRRAITVTLVLSSHSARIMPDATINQDHDDHMTIEVVRDVRLKHAAIKVEPTVVVIAVVQIALSGVHTVTIVNVLVESNEGRAMAISKADRRMLTSSASQRMGTNEAVLIMETHGADQASTASARQIIVAADLDVMIVHDQIVSSVMEADGRALISAARQEDRAVQHVIPNAAATVSSDNVLMETVIPAVGNATISGAATRGYAVV